MRRGYFTLIFDSKGKELEGEIVDWVLLRTLWLWSLYLEVEIIFRLPFD